ncbi:hypothetical protein COV19_05785 [Candidatus Woesearchaeota archaeon CG10_big_fil_rev_8_21_14_0_10_44_13]|nr:MAG: hypothetical protein COV19_05785 [Candidatus Woesearchaeota archaeon CG10_big_fil_rev_8_21_14_0_10_44_13]
MDKDYKTRTFRESDLAGVISLCRLVFGSKTAEKFKKNWHWYSRENPVLRDHKLDSWVVENKGKIIGYINLNPGMIKMGDKNVMIAWGGGLMAHPGHRGKGIGKEMVKRWKEEANICLALGVGDVAYGIESSMGWSNLDMAKAMIRIINPEKFLSYSLKMKKGRLSYLLSRPLGLILAMFFSAKKPGRYLADHTIDELKNFDSRFDVFWDEVSDDLGIAAVRDKEYLDWKYTKNPTRGFRIFAAADKKGRINGYVVITKISSENFNWGRVVEFVASPHDIGTMQALIWKINDYFIEEGCDAIQAYGMKRQHRKMFSKNGFIYSRTMGQRFIVKIDDTKNLPDIRFFKNPDNWFVTAGDSDFTI